MDYGVVFFDLGQRQKDRLQQRLLAASQNAQPNSSSSTPSTSGSTTPADQGAQTPPLATAGRRPFNFAGLMNRTNSSESVNDRP